MGPGQRFGDSNQNESIQPEELQALLVRLHAPDHSFEPKDDYATVSAVCEATGQSWDRVWEVLAEIRELDLEAKIHRRLQEAEEPLYRVERPDTAVNPVENSMSKWARQRTARTILDKIPRPEHVRKRDHQDIRAEASSRAAGNFILFATILLLVVIGVIAVIGVMQGLPTPGR